MELAGGPVSRLAADGVEVELAARQEAEALVKGDGSGVGRGDVEVRALAGCMVAVERVG
jgi:hypothetical protein